MQVLICNEIKIRLNKFLSQSGICSRRQADILIESGKVKVNLKRKNNDVFAKVELGDILSIGDQVQVDISSEHYKYSISNRDYGIELETDNTKLKDRIDKSSKIEYEYIVKVRESCTPSIANALLKGIEDRDSKNGLIVNYKAAKKATITGENRNIISVVLLENRANIIKRLMNALHLTVDHAKRIRIANLNLNGLSVGESRELKDLEVRVLMGYL